MEAFVNIIAAQRGDIQVREKTVLYCQQGGDNMVGRCVVYRKFGDPQSVLTVENRTIAPLSEEDVLIRMNLMPINPSDLIPMRGAYAHRITLPAVPGYEGVGVIEEVGANGLKAYIGKRVLPLRAEGTWQDYVKMKKERLIFVPDQIDDDTAAQMYINPLTAWVVCKEKLCLQQEDVVIINAAGSALGKIFAQLSIQIGFTLIAVVRREESKKALQELGATFVIDENEESFVDQVMAITAGKGADVAIDSIGGEKGDRLAGCVRTQGKFLAIGLLSRKQVDWAHHSKRLQTGMFHLRHWNQQVSLSHWHRVYNELLSIVANQRLILPNLGDRYSLSNVNQAVKQAEPFTSRYGKVVLCASTT